MTAKELAKSSFVFALYDPYVPYVRYIPYDLYVPKDLAEKKVPGAKCKAISISILIKCAPSR
jgi:hypothetical protein